MEQAPNDFSSMHYKELESNPISGHVFQEMALKYLKEQDTEWFEREYTGDLDSDGYLVPKPGRRSHVLLPSQCITGGIQIVADMTKAELKSRGL